MSRNSAQAPPWQRPPRNRPRVRWSFACSISRNTPLCFPHARISLYCLSAHSRANRGLILKFSDSGNAREQDRTEKYNWEMKNIGRSRASFRSHSRRKRSPLSRIPTLGAARPTTAPAPGSSGIAERIESRTGYSRSRFAGASMTFSYFISISPGHRERDRGAPSVVPAVVVVRLLVSDLRFSKAPARNPSELSWIISARWRVALIQRDRETPGRARQKPSPLRYRINYTRSGVPREAARNRIRLLPRKIHRSTVFPGAAAPRQSDLGSTTRKT